MNARILVTVGAVVALAAPAAATAKLIPIKQAAKPVAKHVVKRHVVPRVLCICVRTPSVGLPAISEAALEAQIDADMIAHGLDPLYGPTLANAALEAEYDAALVRLGLFPVFGTTTAHVATG